METIKLEGKWKATTKGSAVSVKLSLKDKVEAQITDRLGNVYKGEFSSLELVPDTRTITKLPYRIVTNFKGALEADPKNVQPLDSNLASFRSLEGLKFVAPLVDIEFDATKL